MPISSEAAFLLCEESAVVWNGPPAASGGLSLSAGWSLQGCVPIRASSWCRHHLQAFGQIVLQTRLCIRETVVAWWHLGTDMADTPWLSEENPILPFLEKMICFAQICYLHGPVSRARYLRCSCCEEQEKDLQSTANLLLRVSKL